MTNNKPLVTVIAACYNHEKFVLECLESIRNQTYPNIQLIITDDFSTDQSVEIIESWIKTYNVKCNFIKHTQNMGLPKTLNEGLRKAQGKYLSVISTDDLMNDYKIEKQVHLMEDDSHIGVIYSGVEVIDENGKKLRISSGNDLGEEIKETLCFYNPIFASSTLIRTSCFEKVGYYNEKYIYEDYDMWLRLSEFFKFTYSSYVSVKYRLVGTSFVHTQKELIRKNHAEILIDNYRRRPALKQQLSSGLTNYAEDLYKHRLPFRTFFLWKRVLKKRRKKTLIMALFSTFGINYDVFDYFQRRLANRN